MKLKSEPLTPQQLLGQKEWNAMIKTQVENALGYRLVGEFTPVKYAPGFYYGIKSTYYNPNTLSALDSLVSETDGVTVAEGVFSSLYEDIIEHLVYNLSTKDQDMIRSEQTKYESLVETIISEYQNCGIDKDPIEYPTVLDIMQRITEITGYNYDDPMLSKKYVGATSLWNALSEYGRLAHNTTNLQSSWIAATKKLEAIQDHIMNPTDKNGGLRVSGQKCMVGWNHLPETAILLRDLQSESEISFTMTAQNFSSKESDFHMSNNVKVRIPCSWLFSAKSDHQSDYDLSKYAAAESEMVITVTFKGMAQVAAEPAALSGNLTEGWFDEEPIKEAAEKTGKDETGYCLNGGEYKPEELFGKNGRLRRLKTFVLSQQPIISLHFSKFNCAQLKEMFSEKTKVSFSFLGGLVKATHENDYTYTGFHYDEQGQTLDVTITPPAIGSVGSLDKQTAFVLGGVIKYYE